jgi:hypothetical protein
MAHFLNTQVMWDFQHAPSRVAEGHPSQHVQQMGDGGPQPIESGSDIMLNYQLSQKLKLIGKSKFNHLIINLTLSLTCGLKPSFNM